MVVLFRLRLSAHALKKFTDNGYNGFYLSRISFYIVLPLDTGFITDYICACTALDSLQQEIIRDNHSARQAHINPTTHNKNP